MQISWVFHFPLAGCDRAFCGRFAVGPVCKAKPHTGWLIVVGVTLCLEDMGFDSSCMNPGAFSHITKHVATETRGLWICRRRFERKRTHSDFLFTLLNKCQSDMLFNPLIDPLGNPGFTCVLLLGTVPWVILCTYKIIHYCILIETTEACSLNHGSNI